MDDAANASGIEPLERTNGEPSGADFFASIGAVSPAATLSGNSGGDGAGSGNGGDQRDSGGTLFDPAIHSGSRRADGTWRRKRGVGSEPRERATGTRRANSKGAASVEAIANTLSAIHLGIASATGFSDLELDMDSEAMPLAKATAEIAKHYDIPAFDPKVMAWVSLCVVMGKVYMPKAALISMELKKRKAEAEGKGQVVGFPGYIAQE